MKRFEELPVWQKARQLVRLIYLVTKEKPFCYDLGLRDQIQRAGVSVMSNIAEGHERGTTQELIYFLFIAKGSCGEVRSHSYIAEDIGYISAETGIELRELSEGISGQIHSWVRHMQGRDFKRGPLRSDIKGNDK